MPKILHCSDVHLSIEEKDYSMTVLKEIIGHAAGHKADHLVFAGDTFNSFEDLVKLAKDFAAAIKALPNTCRPILIAGNHEERGRNKRSIHTYNLGIPPENIIDSDVDWKLISECGVEFLAIPHRNDYREYLQWAVPEKKTKHRVAVAHAVIADLVFTGPDTEEEKVGVMDQDLFTRFGADYAALGHIHAARQKREKNLLMMYAGSPRVWRKDESGPREIVLVDLGEDITPTKIKIKAAGEYRHHTVTFSLDGKPDKMPEEIVTEAGINDWIWIDFAGLVENEVLAKDLAESYRKAIETRVRRIDLSLDGLETCAGISTHEIAKKFLELWEKGRPADVDDTLQVWEEARAIGLKKIKEKLEARR